MEIEEARSIGGLLLLKRTEAGLSQLDIANRLYLAESYIDALENDEFDKLNQSMVFVRGHVRGYAGLVGIDEADIISLLDSHGVNDKSREAAFQPEGTQPDKPQVKATDKRMRWSTYAIVLLFLLLMSFWWHSRINKKAIKTPVPTPTTVISKQGVKSPATNNSPSKPAGNTSVTAKAPDANKIVNQLHMDNGDK